MLLSNRILKILLTLAVASLVLNDVARLSFPTVFQVVFVQNTSAEEEEDNNPTNTLFEEEVKHKTLRESLDALFPRFVDELDVAVAHRISDDDVRHLAFLPIFSPPPNLA